MSRAVVFDIGRVLIDFSHEPFRQFLLDHQVGVRSYEDFLKQTKLLEYESGRISSDEFVGSVRKMLNGAATAERITAQWNGIFSPLDEMLDLALALREQHRVYLFSNTNELHWRFLNQRFALEKLAHGVILSFRAGAMKPDPRIYHHLMEQFSLSPSEIIFLDDREENIATARDLGWEVIHHRNFSESRAILLERGVKLPIRTAPVQ